MYPAVVPGASSSCSAAFTRNHSSRSSPKLFSVCVCVCVCVCGQKTPFQGLSLLNAKRGVKVGTRRSFSISRRRFEVTDRTAGSSKNIGVEVDKPLGVTLGQKSGGGVVITARATHICLDCGFIYTMTKPFDEQPDDYACPQCIAPKKRFARYDASTGRAIGGVLPPIGVLIGLVAGFSAVGQICITNHTYLVATFSALNQLYAWKGVVTK